MKNAVGIKGTSETLAPAKERPILFSPQMVDADQDGRKTHTRRLNNLQEVNKHPDDWEFRGFVKEDPHLNPAYTWAIFGNKKNKGAILLPCPYGKPGDLLWVREEHYRYGHWKRNGLTKLGNEKWRFVADKADETIYYDPYGMPHSFYISRDKKNPERPHWYKRLARFMPKAAARTWKRVVDVRVERVQEISEYAAQEEGIDQDTLYYDYLQKKFNLVDPIYSFQTLWQSINGRGSWEANPWVWAVEFEKVDMDTSETLAPGDWV